MMQILLTVALLATTLLFSSCYAPSPEPKPHPVVIVHGIFDSGDQLGSLKKNLEKKGYRCIAPSLTPNNGAAGIEPLSSQLCECLDNELKPNERYHLVGFSMGGLVARDFLTKSDKHSQCVSLTTLASPHHGTKLAKLYPLKAGKQMRPDSGFLKSLNRNPRSVPKNTLSVRTPTDMVIIPSSSSILDGAENKVVKSFSHASMLRTRPPLKMVLAHLQDTEKE